MEIKIEGVSEPIPIIADVPSADPRLGFQVYAEAIAGAVRGGEPAQFTVGLYGAWGSGKSSLLNGVTKVLSREGSNVIPVYFDAWRYEKSEHIIIPILFSMHSALRRAGDERVAGHLERALKSVIYSLNFRIQYIGGVEVKPAEIKKNWEDQGLPALDEAFARPFHELREIPQALEGKRIAVLIDDLDRCSPEKVVSVLESINLVMDVPGLIFVLALDYDVLINAIKTRYPHVSGDSFIQKMVQLPFRVPPLNLDESDFLADLIPDWAPEVYGLPHDFSSYIRNIAVSGLDANPRQIKRLINSFLLLHRVVKVRKLSSLKLEILAALIGVQLRWPSYYRDFQEAVMADHKEPFEVFSQAQDEPALLRYAEQMFQRRMAILELKQILQLTAVVAPEEDRKEDAFIEELRKQNRELLIAELVKRGYQPTGFFGSNYSKGTKSTIRFTFTNRDVRIEEYESNTWRLRKSYSLTQDPDIAVQAMDHPEDHVLALR